jgi:hypothetical protein
MKRELKTRPIYDCRCDERLKPKDDESTCLDDIRRLFIIRVNRELKRVYRNGCRYNERLNADVQLKQEDLKRLTHTGLRG